MDYTLMCDYCNDWPSINDFISIGEFERFENFIDDQRRQGFLDEVPVGKLYAGPNLKERWFKCSKCRRIWRLVYPEFSFRGLWELIDNR
jgi:hypothetical protein